MKRETKVYNDAWYKVEYEHKDTMLMFKAYKILGMCEDETQNDYNSKPAIGGFIKWDGCCEFEHSEHYCGFGGVKQHYLLMHHVFNHAKEVFDNDQFNDFDL